MAIAGAVTAVAGVSAYSANKANKQAKSAANTQAVGIRNAIPIIAESNLQAQETLRPTMETGEAQRENVTSSITNLLGQQGKAISGADQMQQGIGQGMSALAAQQGNLDVNKFLDPSMAFTMAQGQKALDASAASRGLALSGAAVKSAMDYSQGLASQNYNNAATQAMKDREQQVGIGTNLAQIGAQGQANNQNMANTGLQTSAQLYTTGINSRASLANLQENLGSNMANAEMSAANTQAAGIAAQKDVLGSALGAAVNTGIGAYFSDEDLKKNIEMITDDEIDDFLSKLDPSQYDYVEDAIEKGAPEDKTVGVMAQDMEKSKIGKTLVEEDEDGDKMVDVPKTVGALVAATANMNKRLKKLEGGK